MKAKKRIVFAAVLLLLVSGCGRDKDQRKHEAGNGSADGAAGQEMTQGQADGAENAAQGQTADDAGKTADGAEDAAQGQTADDAGRTADGAEDAAQGQTDGAGGQADAAGTKESGNDVENGAGRDGQSADSPQSGAQGSGQDAESLIHPQGGTLEERFAVPAGYERTAAKQGSLAEFLRTYRLKKDQSPVLLYDGSKKNRQDVHAAVFTLPVEPVDLQQCADSVMRVYAEYFRDSGQYERIAFHFTNGFLAEYVKWREGCRIQVNGSQAAWKKTAGYDDSYEAFSQYMRTVFTYAGTLSMEAESEEIAWSQIRIGDVFLKGGSPGHVVMVVDVCKDAGGRRAFLLAQGYMPAQEFHVLKNPQHEADPWYYVEESAYPFVTPEYTFEEGSLRRLIY